MPVYEYSAYDTGGRSRTGIIDADSERAARHKLRGQGLFAFALRETDARSRPGRGRLVFSRVKKEEIFAFTRQLATLLEAGIPLVTALEALQQQNTAAGLRTVLVDLKEVVREGGSFSSALARHSSLFSPVYINMVRAAEASGTLGLVLERLADLGEQQLLLAGRVKAALVYPLFMTVIGTLILFALLVFVVPGITEMFVEMQAALPRPTVILMAVSDALRRIWWLLAIIPVAGLLAGRILLRRPAGRRKLDTLLLRLPLFGAIVRRLVLARFARTAGGLLQSGVSLPHSLRIVRNVVNNAPVAAAIDHAIEEVERGRGLAAALADSPWFPAMVIQMLAAGEKSGGLDTMLLKVAKTCEQESETRITALTALLEPVMILVMGGVVGFIVLAILLPVFEMQQLIR